MSMNLNEVGSWASILSFPLSVYSVYLVGRVKSNIIANRRKTRLRSLISEIATIPNDALPLSSASKSKLESLENNLPSGYFLYWSAKSKSVRKLRSAIANQDIAAVKEISEDYRSQCEDL